MDRRNKKIAKGKKWSDDRKNKYSKLNIDQDNNYNELSYGDFSPDNINEQKIEEEKNNMQKEDIQFKSDKEEIK